LRLSDCARKFGKMKKYDLIIVGAGIMGTFHAFHAAKLGKRVLLLEKDNRPVGSTIQNFGQVVPSGLDAHWQKFGIRSLEIFDELQANTDFTLVKNGSVYIASDEDELTLINEVAELHNHAGYSQEILSKTATKVLFPDVNSDYIKGSIFYPKEYSVNSSEFIYKLIGYCVEELGVVYKNHTAVINVEDQNGEVKVETADREVYLSEKAIICSGYVFNLLFPEVYRNSGLIVSKLQMMKTRSLKQFNLKANILTGLTIRRYESFEECPSFSKLKTPDHLLELKKWGIHILFKQLPDGSIIVGDSHEYAPVSQVENLGLGVSDYINNLMKNEAELILNIPRNAYSQTWAGYYAQHPDGIFEYKVSENIEIRTGIGGKGMTTSAGYSEFKINQLFR
jgi:D-hydroxyproline dehydrogenase subunit beta